MSVKNFFKKLVDDHGGTKVTKLDIANFPSFLFCLKSNNKSIPYPFPFVNSVFKIVLNLPLS